MVPYNPLLPRNWSTQPFKLKINVTFMQRAFIASARGDKLFIDKEFYITFVHPYSYLFLLPCLEDNAVDINLCALSATVSHSRRSLVVKSQEP